ncbi:MAG: DUF1326 domain-containing protein [Rhodospirillales bacterium]|nr:DUF1326 domain-containing protein [Rhodospirillales bacterium]
MATPAWQLRGDYMESCNCDYLCPCVYTNPQGQTTHDHCTAALVFRIAEGRRGATVLDGLAFALLIRSGRVMADGNWRFAVVVDEAADSPQREALAPIVAGEAGGTPGAIRAGLVTDFRGVAYAPIRIAAEGLRRTVDIPGVLAFAIEGVASRNKSGQPFYIDNTAHPAGKRLALARAERFDVQGFGLDLSMSGKGNNGHFAPFAWSG